MSPSSRADRLRGRLSINPDAATAPAPAADPQPVPETAPREPEAPPEATPSKPASRPASETRPSAVDDPSITPGKKDYRSFYLEDATFARFRAAIYWLARREDADDVPDSMSSAVEDWMEQTARDLEQRYNNGDVFRAPPPTRRRRRTRA